MDVREFGATGLRVSALGFGAGHIGDPALDETRVEQLLHRVLDLGITLVDTARSYGLSEERIGRHLAHRRSEFVLSTKVGYGIAGVPDWTREAVSRGVDEALKRLQTDHLDIVHLHSCPVEVLAQGEVIEALEKAREQGKIRVMAYSGDNVDLAYAVHSGRFASIQASLNVCDQRIIDEALPEAKGCGMGVIAKRPVANAPWRFAERPVGHDAETYWERWTRMGFASDRDWQSAALRFSAYTWGVDSCIVATTNPAHLAENVRAVEQGKLPDDVIHQIRDRFRQHDQGWVGRV